VFGLLGGIARIQEDVMHMKTHRRSPVRRQLSLVGWERRAQMPVAAIAAAIGGNVRVGLEDSLWIGAGSSAASNADQVTQSQDHRRIGAGHRDGRRGARNLRTPRARQGRILTHHR